MADLRSTVAPLLLRRKVTAVIGGVLSLSLMVAVVYSLVRLANTRSSGADAPDGDLRTTVVRFFRLALLFGTAVLVAEGVAGLVAEIVPRSGEMVRDTDLIARSLAFTVVGGPVLTLLARWTRRSLADDPREVDSVGWGLYVAGAVSVALILVMTAWFGVLRWGLASGTLDRIDLGRLLTWTPVWIVHWRSAQGVRRPGGRVGLHILFGSGIGLATAAVGVGFAVRAALRSVYDAAFLTLVTGGGFDEFARPLIAAVVGGVVWWWYWFRHGAAGPRDNRWHAYVLLVGVLGSLVTAVVGAALLIRTTLEWLFGDPAASTAGGHFFLVPGAVAAAAVGAVGWSYHRGVLGTPEPGARTEVDRIYAYLATAVGLVAVTVGITVAFSAFLESVAGPESVVGRSGVANTIVFAVTMMLVGGPVWVVYWRGAQRHATDVRERRSVTRRVFLLLLFGIAAIVALVTLVIALIIAFEDVTKSRVGVATLFRVRVPLALVITTGIVAAYHAVVFRDDRAATPQQVQPLVHDVVLLARDGRDMATDIAVRTGSHVRLWQRLDAPAGSGEPLHASDPDAIMAAVSEATERHLLVEVADDGSWNVVPFRES